MLDVARFVDGIHDYIGRSLRPLVERLEAVEKRQPEKGEDGKSVDIDQVRALVVDEVKKIPPARDGDDGVVDYLEVQNLVNKAVANIPAPKNGKNADPIDYDRIISEAVKQIPVPEQVDYDFLIAETVKRIPTPNDGESVDFDEVVSAIVKTLPEIKQPKDGESVDFDEVVEAVFKRMTVIVQPGPAKDGTSVTLNDVRPMLEAEVAKWALDFERRAQGVLERSIERMPKVKHGKDADPINYEMIIAEAIKQIPVPKNGLDGFSPDHIDIQHKDEGRFVVYKFICGDREIVHEKKTGVLIYREVYETARSYDTGDSVTYGGSLWIAVKDKPGKPGAPDSGWRLAVKKGKDAA